jgi:hypothetical protein
MDAPGQVERLWTRRLRWRMRGAWQWPAFALMTVIDAILLTRLPFYGDGPGSIVAGLLVAGFVNLLAVAVVGPLIGVRVRRRRPDLPKLIATDSASTGVLIAIGVAMLAGGLAHRPAVRAERAELGAVVASTHDYVVAREPAYRDGLPGIDAMRVDDDLYRSCVPGADPRRWLCLFVSTDQRPPGVTRDSDQAPNAAYRMHGGFR